MIEPQDAENLRKDAFCNQRFGKITTVIKLFIIQNRKNEKRKATRRGKQVAKQPKKIAKKTARFRKFS